MLDIFGSLDVNVKGVNTELTHKQLSIKSPGIFLAASFAVCVVAGAVLPARAETDAASSMTTSSSTMASAPKGVAATVDGYQITMADIQQKAMDQEGFKAYTALVNGAIAFGEAKKYGISVTQAELDNRIQELRTTYAPESLGDVERRHGSSLQELYINERLDIVLALIAGKDVPLPAFVHLRRILIKVPIPGVPFFGSVRHTDAEAEALIDQAQAELKAGKSFEDVANKYTEDEAGKGKGGEWLVLWPGLESYMAIDEGIRTAAYAMKTGDISPPMRDNDGWVILQAVSTSADHPASEDQLYLDTAHLYQIDKGGPHAEDLLQFLHDKAKIVDYIAQSPTGVNGLAAIVNGTKITMDDLHQRAEDMAGDDLVQKLINQHLVYTEAAGEGIVVTQADVDARVATVRKSLLLQNQNLDTLLQQQHKTIAQIDDDLRYQITLNRLAGKDVTSPEMVHAYRIFVGVKSSTNTTATHTDDEALAIIKNVQDQLKAGRSFQDLAKQYSEDAATKDSGGDLGILYYGMGLPPDDYVMRAAMDMNAGQLTETPVRALDGYDLVDVVSTSESHPVTENFDYQNASWEYKELQAAYGAQAYVDSLRKKAKIVDYLTGVTPNQ